MVAKICKIVILISGNGSNLQAFIDQVQSGELPISIEAVICNRPGVRGIERAKQAAIPTHVVDHHTFSSRESFERALVQAIDQYRPTLVALAGFMRILSAVFVQHFRGRLLNIHPSLLPKYPGLNTHQRAIDAGDEQAGATVHFVTEQLDGGPVIIQAGVPILSHDDAQALATRILAREHVIYPLAVKWFAENRLQLKDNQVVLDGRTLPPEGYCYDGC